MAAEKLLISLQRVAGTSRLPVTLLDELVPPLTSLGGKLPLRVLPEKLAVALDGVGSLGRTPVPALAATPPQAGTGDQHGRQND